MKRETTQIGPAQIAAQMDYCMKVHAMNAGMDHTPLAMVDTYGCQQNEADSERLRGYLSEMGYGFTDDEHEADLVLVNTCAIREHAEQRVLGNVGALTHTKRANPNQIVCLCGCMAQEEHVAKKVKESYRQVDLLFGPHALWRFPELLWRFRATGKRVFERTEEPGSIAEGIPVVRQDGVKAWVSIMYGCNNFCTYCIVPYVRGRERSRKPEDILAEIRGLAEEGYKDITLLGQNVNSYGKDLDEPMDFADLLARAAQIPGEFLLRFMTSHPKDASQKLFDTMAAWPEKIAPCFHLPFQAGSDRVLKAMNRVYDRAGYLDKVRRLRAAVPDAVITSDVIVGFPGETPEEFEETMTLIEEVRFDALFTFIYSPRVGTPAASLPDPMSREEKLKEFQRLVERQDQISEEKHAAYIGRTVRCLVDGKDEKGLTARTPGNRLVRLTGGESLIGRFVPIHITGANKWSLFGEQA
ncbi:tRNA (N6-isopentenyl adenosine(37)-C2)-methylthiotransferase MiaB [Pseudoflavonifractor sp. MSJ-37]|uniref:tRNA (N6-isopentenyl adenosine(37)-C2)-methylthiotransferase MiaB n=1 Tax=Pseudoflavonifractor sp. MSJ-37 TaxID=2841531 RepID=UPI001C0F9A50|nr:tRNA (N6-isopentenyl adenosine(37)-C2)-methylthiotransferase MiaB [Pseudoflavonifractor sp. MSJ-37]MBU5435237.1 tRNA (N6-isopentenyl adenosine(37)-C2)-methylthiotransferase MiaB [Pseudoflavonifractor sp. MSJ-37]